MSQAQSFTVWLEEGSPDIEEGRAPGGKGYVAVVNNPDGSKHHRHGLWMAEPSKEKAWTALVDVMLDCPKCEKAGLHPQLAEIPGRPWHSAVDK